MKRAQTCGGQRGKPRRRRGFLFRRSERALPPMPPQRTANTFLDELDHAVQMLATLPPPWIPDIDDPIYDPPGHVVDGSWTGKIYTGRRGSWCTYLDEEIAYRTTRIVIALSAVRNALPELLRLARVGAATEKGRL